MRTTTALGIIVTVSIAGLAFMAVAQDDDGVIEWHEAATAADTTARTEDPDESNLMVHYQTGLFTKVAGDPLLHGDQKWLVTLDLSFSGYDRSHATWGLGIHAAIDEATGRYGPKFLWRIPLSKGGQGYFQISPGIYIAGDDAMEWPSGFLEVELGYSNSIALAAVVERLNYGESNNGTGAGYERTAGYVGLKLGQWPGLLATAGLLAVAAASLASMSNSGWN